MEINAIWRSHRIFQSSISKLIRLEPCQPDERIYMGGISNPPFFYMYQCFFRDLGVCLPFTQFKCDFLTFVNVAACQLHPNSWSFLRAFQVLCSTLGIRLSLPIFLHFYQLKLGERPYGWASLNGSKVGGCFRFTPSHTKASRMSFSGFCLNRSTR
uniref:Transposase (putative) gypsy type domain-containing protein n=1 Tax=Cajanus cajan TaxID=3821 RepID=A0A151SE96_CAJCA|nr:hypothetical protein KK1_024924 [Cajanus cajan]